MDEPDDDLDEIAFWNKPVFSSFRPLVCFFYFGSTFYALLAVTSFGDLTMSVPAWRLSILITFIERAFWAIGCLGIARVIRHLSRPRATHPVNPPSPNPDEAPESG